MDPVVHFEMPYENRERMATFYGSAFGWQTQMLGEDMGQYVIATTTETDEKGPKTPEFDVIDMCADSKDVHGSPANRRMADATLEVVGANDQAASSAL